MAAVGAAFSHRGASGLAPTLALVVVVAMGGSLVLAYLIARAVTRPLERLRIAARALASGSFAGVAALGGGSEVEELGSAFNEMAARLHESLRSLDQERSRLEALLASSRDAIVVLDADGAVRYLNRAASSLYHVVEGRSLAEVMRDPDFTALLRRMLAAYIGDRGAAQERVRATTLHIDERDAWVQATASLIAGGGGWALLVVLHDVTEERRLEATRRDFVANVSHELRTPLAGIKAVAETLRDGALEDPTAAREFLSQVETEVDRLVQLVEELLHLARIESGAEVAMAAVDPAAVLSDSVERFRPQAEREAVSLSLDLGDSLPVLSANAAQLGQAVGNLIHNALKFTPAGGWVRVSAESRGSALLIQVADSGTGIEATDLVRIFERFYVADRARAARGTGLGLAIVKHVAIAHGGTVQAESAPGRGSTFTIELPVLVAASETGSDDEQRGAQSLTTQ
jgi:two-component system phosphate regulon sensor histidine kinase PhoR